MRIRIISVFFLCVVIIVFFAISRRSLKQQATLTFEAGSIPLNVESNIVPTVTPEKVDDFQSRKVSPLFPPHDPADATVTDSSKYILNNNENHLTLHIVDAFGYPIPAGEVQLNKGPMHPFKDGLLSLSLSSSKPCELIAQAEGYRTATQTVGGVDASTTITLEYYSNFTVFVFSSSSEQRMNIPMKDAKVTLWKGKEVIRPIQKSIYVDIGTSDFQPARLFSEDDGIRVQRFTTRSMDQIIPPMADSEGYATINSGSRILGLAGCMWLQNDRIRYWRQPDFRPEEMIGAKYLPLAESRSPRLRIWDTLSMCGVSNGCEYFGGKRDILEFENSFGRSFTYMPLPNIPPNASIVDVQTTNSSGMCQFAKLEPAFYYVQANHEGEKSSIASLHPARAGTELYLKKNSVVKFTVKRKAPFLERNENRVISDAEVMLNKIDLHGETHGYYMAKTDQRGETILRPVAWGAYKLTVNPPSHYNLPSQNRELTITDAFQDILIEYDVGVSVQGIVLDSVTSTPVNGFSLELIRCAGNEVSDRRISDMKGYFRFYNVPVGDYFITQADDGVNSHCGYIGDSHSMLIPSQEINSNNVLVQSQSLLVKNDTVSGIVYLVTPTVPTSFSGIVTTKEGLPVQGAYVSSFFDKWKSSGSERTDQDGRFSLEYQILQLKGTSFPFRLIAEIRDEAQPYWEKSGDGFLLRKGQKNVYSRGSIEIPNISGGETIAGINIVINSLPRCAIIGKIHLPDDGDLDQIIVNVSQHGSSISGKVYGDGTYIIDNVTPGKAAIMCKTPANFIKAGEYGSVLYQRYATEIINFVIPENQDTFTQDIVLQKSGYLAGIILDTEGNSIPGMRVRIVNHPSGLPYDELTQANGRFWHALLKSKERYNLEVYSENGENPIASFDGLTPSRSDIKITVNP